MSAPVYKFVELSVVTDASLEDCVNEWVGQGWALDAIRFVTGEHSRRPSMAFVSFIRGDARAVQARAPEPARIHKVVELGELDLGDDPPLEAPLDWANARTRRGAAPPDAKQRRKKRA